MLHIEYNNFRVGEIMTLTISVLCLKKLLFSLTTLICDYDQTLMK